jgi:hypothetical protein
MPNKPTVGHFRHHEQARQAIRALDAAGIDRHAISVLTRSPTEAHELHQETGAAEDLERIIQRHPLSDVLDIIGEVESILVPGFGGVLASGHLLTRIKVDLEDIRGRGGPKEERGAITGALVGLGIPVDEAARLERAVDSGQILVVVHGRYDAAAARAALLTSTAHTSG